MGILTQSEAAQGTRVSMPPMGAVQTAGVVGAPDSPAPPAHPAGSAAPAAEALSSVTRCPGNRGGSRLGPRALAPRASRAGPVPAPRFRCRPVLLGL